MHLQNMKLISIFEHDYIIITLQIIYFQKLTNATFDFHPLTDIVVHIYTNNIIVFVIVVLFSKVPWEIKE